MIQKTATQRITMIEYVMLMDTKRVKKIMKEIMKKIGIKKRNGMRMEYDWGESR